MRRAALLIALCACKTSSEVKSEAHAETLVEKQLYEEGHSASSGQEHSGPWTETTWEFAADAPGVTPDPTHPSLPPVGQGIGSGAQAPRPLGNVTRVTVRDYQGRDVTWNTQSEGLRGLEAHAEAKVDAKATEVKQSAPAGLLGSLVGFWPLLLAAALFVAWRLIKPVVT